MEECSKHINNDQGSEEGERETELHNSQGEPVGDEWEMVIEVNNPNEENERKHLRELNLNMLREGG